MTNDPWTTAAFCIRPPVEPKDLPIEFGRKGSHPRSQFLRHKLLENLSKGITGTNVLVASGFVNQRDDADRGEAVLQVAAAFGDVHLLLLPFPLTRRLNDDGADVGQNRRLIAIGCANRFMLDVASRIEGRVQLTTDGFKAYKWATALAFPEGSVDYAQLIKVYAGQSDGNPNSRYSPPVCCGARKEPVRGWPDADHISTSFVERANLTMRMGMRRWQERDQLFQRPDVVGDARGHGRRCGIARVVPTREC